MRRRTNLRGRREGGREGGRERGRERGREGGREERREWSMTKMENIVFGCTIIII